MYRTPTGLHPSVTIAVSVYQPTVLRAIRAEHFDLWSDFLRKTTTIMSTPTHYATYQKTDDHIIIKFKDIEIARTTRPVKLQEYHEKYDFEPVYYIPLSDIHQELLRANQRATNCPIKGKAQYWDLEVDGLTLSNVMWSYPEPLEHAQPIKGYAAFDQKKGIELVV